ncbi:HORMA domain-containing protein 2 isoform X2 [Halyomorpha halys]|uniref:HORMA domain-containing protein 2 isoform X2 n=1 Tax=Halyomorpha halys TaxID=286706 RepID=UPI0006D4FD71|nr:HORMA domain-containing protein 2-like isoform X2 [Halyomorpha halys]KAE8573725.1 HORMA domain-containing protein 2-like [Halyomorpha halys]
MATEQLQLVKQTHSAGLQEIFNQDVTTVKGSLVFVKQFTALSFSIISYMRSIFPEIAYTEKDFDNVKVKILAGNYECKDAYLMTKWIKSAFDALDNSYMRELVLEILTPEDSLLEYYAVEYKYTQEGPTCSLSTNTKTPVNFDRLKFENSTKKLINNLLTITENLEPLPQKYKLQLRINYYDDATPLHYKPKFFSHSKPNDLQLEKLKKQSIGSLESPHHSISIYSGSALMALDDSQQSFFSQPELENGRLPKIENSKEMPIKDHLEKVIKTKEYAESSGTKRNSLPHHTDNQPSFSIQPEFDKGRLSNLGKFIENPVKSNIQKNSGVTEMTKISAGGDTKGKELKEDDSKSQNTWTWSFDKYGSQDDDTALMADKRKKEILCCLCTLEFRDDNTFKCQHCESLHHLVCYKISSFGKIPENGCCFACAKLDNSIECTDLTLMKYKPRQAKHLAMYRQVLYRCHGMKFVTVKYLESLGISPELVEEILKKLLQETFVKPQNKAKGLYKINQARLKHFFKIYFST